MSPAKPSGRSAARPPRRRPATPSPKAAEAPSGSGSSGSGSSGSGSSGSGSSGSGSSGPGSSGSGSSSSQLLTGWGRAGSTRAEVASVTTAEQVAEQVRSARGRGRGILARGLGRSYNDAAMNGGGTVLRLGGELRRIGPIAADGTVTLGGGVSLHDLIARAMPLGFFVPVTPGTRHVTVAGALAMDVHGKNHHRDGSIGHHVTHLDVVDGRGESRRVTPGDEAYAGVVGGLGLTGVVTSVGLRLMPVETSSITVHTERTPDLDSTMAALARDDAVHRYTVAWLDTLAGGRSLGRAVVTSGDHSPAGTDGAAEPAAYQTSSPLPTPPWVPDGLLVPWRMRLFNEAYYRRAPARPTVSQESIPTFFHPLDVIDGWNRLYGSPGFVQYQYVVEDPTVVRQTLEVLQRAKVGGFLAVLKRFGPAADAPLSFPRLGWTLAVDIPSTPRLAGVLDTLDDIVVGAGGRLYLAKDGRMRPELLPVMYPGIERWRALRDELDPDHVFTSDLARRLSL